jgi:hypothetical protein
MASKLECDEASWPLVILTAPVQWGADSVVRYVEETTALAQRGTPFALILDLTQSALPTVDPRRRLAAHRRWLFQVLGDRLVAEGVVLRSRAHHESFAVLDELGLLQTRQQFFGNLDAAIGFAVARLAERGLPVVTAAPRPSGVLFKPPRKAYGPGPEHDVPLNTQLRRFS